MQDELGGRMKAQYEDRTRFYLPRRTYSILRCDGRAFHTFTREMKKPFDDAFSEAMIVTANALLREIQGARLGYVQSDEISVLFTDFETVHTDAWFGGNIQKQCSIGAAIATAAFNTCWDTSIIRPAHFDARVFTIPDPTEVENYFVWRQADALRNSIQSLGQAHFSHKALQGLNGGQIQEKLWSEKNINWNVTPAQHKRGVVFYKTKIERPRREIVPPAILGSIPEEKLDEMVVTSVWTNEPAPEFTKNRDWLQDRIPRHE